MLLPLLLPVALAQPAAESPATELPAKTWRYAAYLRGVNDQIRAQWHERLDQVPTTVNLTEAAYLTTVRLCLDPAGSILELEVVASSEVPALDDAVTGAIRGIASFSAPPEGFLVEDRVCLPDMDFNVQLAEGATKPTERATP